MSTTEQSTPTAARRQVSPSKAEVSHARALSKEVGLEYVDLDRYPLNAAATSLLPEQASRRQHTLAIGWKYGTPVVAVARPDNLMIMDDLRTIIGRDIHAVVACESQIDAYIERMYSRAEAPGNNHARPVRAASETSMRTPSASLSVVAEPASPPDEPEEQPEPAVATEPEAPPAPQAKGEPTLDLLEVAPAAPQLSEVGDTAKAESEAVDALLAATEIVNGSAVGTRSRKAATDTPKPATPDLSELLVHSGQVTREEMEAALRESAATGRSLGEILSELGLVSEEDLIRAAAAEAGMEFVDLNDQQLDPEATKLIPEALARRHRVLALTYRGDTPVIGMANPSDVFAVDDLRTLLGNDLHIVVCSPGQIAEYLSRVYRHDRETTLAAQSAASQTSGADETKITELTDLHSVVEDAPIVKYVNLILRQALQERASDVHIEPSADDLRIRFRIDGVLHEVTRSPKAIQGGVTTRLKVMASLDIAEHRIPQDGRITLTAGRREIDLRVATLPTVHGEKIVLRVLDKSSASLNLSELRLPAQRRKALPAGLQEAVRDHPRDGPDRIRQVDDVVRDLERAQLARAQPHHGRGPGRVPAPRRQSGSGEPQGGAPLRERPAIHPALRPGRGPRGRDPRPRDRGHRGRSRSHRSPRAVEPAHQRRRRHADAPRRDGCGALPRRFRP